MKDQRYQHSQYALLFYTNLSFAAVEWVPTKYDVRNGSLVLIPVRTKSTGT